MTSEARLNGAGPWLWLWVVAGCAAAAGGAEPEAPPAASVSNEPLEILSETPLAPSASASAADKPKEVGVSALALGTNASCALLFDGSARCWGGLMYTVSGHEPNVTNVSGPSPFALEGLSTAKALSLGTFFGAAIDNGGRGLVFGNFSWVYDEGAPPYRPKPLSGGGDLRQIAAGPSSICGVRTDGSVRCWGSGYGVGRESHEHAKVEGVEGAVEVAVGSNHACARLATGAVSCWGANTKGQLGDGTRSRRIRPVGVSGLPARATALALGGAKEVPPERLEHGNFSCALLETGAVFCWGDNDHGQLGVAALEWRAEPRAVPGVTDATALAAGVAHVCALRKEGNVTCWGDNREGQLGRGQESDRELPGAVKSLKAVTGIAAAGFHTCARDGALKLACWGDNLRGQLGSPGKGALLPRPVDGFE